jgi:hypothetical protein
MKGRNADFFLLLKQMAHKLCTNQSINPMELIPWKPQVAHLQSIHLRFVEP